MKRGESFIVKNVKKERNLYLFVMKEREKKVNLLQNCRFIEKIKEL